MYGYPLSTYRYLLYIQNMTTPTQIGQYAIVDDKTGINISTRERLELALGTPVEVSHPLALSQTQAKKVTQNRIRSAMAELAHGKIDKVSAWLDNVAADDPARAIELFLQLTEFSLPKLKAVAIDVKSSDGNVKTLSVAQLEALVNGAGGDHSIVSEQ